MFGRWSGGHRCVLGGMSWTGLEEFGCGGEALGTGCGDTFGAHGLAANGVRRLWGKVGEARRDIGRGGDEVFVFTLFAELREGDNGAFRAGSEDASRTHEFAPDLEGSISCLMCLLGGGLTVYSPSFVTHRATL